MKRTYKELFILFLIFSIVFSSLTGAFFAVPDQVYAADQWENVTQDDLVTAFRYYCKSRNLTIDGSIADALTSFTTTTFNNICDTLGIDVNALQADLKKTVEGNLGLRFLMNQQGVLAYNRIFAEFLQNNDLAVGDDVNNKVVYSGKYFTDGDGYNSLIYITNNGIGKWNDFGTFQMGSPYRYTGEQLFYKYAPSITEPFTGFTHTEVFNLTDSVSAYNFSCYIVGNSNSYGIQQGVSKTDNISNGTLLNRTLKTDGTYVNYQRDGNLGIVYDTYTQKFYLCIVTHWLSNNRYYFMNLTNLSDPDSDDYDISVNTPDNTIINNNTYNNNWTIIYNDGDTYISDDDDEPTPDQEPGGGGGGGGGDDDPNDPDVPSYDPYPGGGGQSTPGTTTTGSDGIFKLPDIGFDFPEIDWSLKNIGDKFPFCIPGDIVSVLTLLNADPEAPKIQATIPIPHVYDWQIDIDFSDYDRYAFIVRTVEFLGFVISLIYLTIRMVKG